MEFVFVVLATELFWNTIILVLLRFTVRAQVWQNLCKRSRCCCRPSLVGDRSTRSSANSRHLTSGSSRVRPGAADCSSARANLLLYMLKRVGLKLHPCLIPRPCGKTCVFYANFNPTLVVCVHGFYYVLCFSLNTTFHQLSCHNPLRVVAAQLHGTGHQFSSLTFLWCLFSSNNKEVVWYLWMCPCLSWPQITVMWMLTVNLFRPNHI